MAIITPLEQFSFFPEQLAQPRQPGLSMFMRTRNGATTLKATIESHIHHVDEIVVLYNQCTDNTEKVLVALQDRYGPDKLRLFHYLPRVFPPGSEGHRVTPPDHPSSLVAYYNAALSLTTRQWASKLDDDHLGIEHHLASLVRDLRHGVYRTGEMACFSGLNLLRDEHDRLGILAHEPFSGSGDIGFFQVTDKTFFKHDPRFETFNRKGLRRIFAGFVYWHLKYLKPEFGFGNYELAEKGNNRAARKRDAFLANRRVISLNNLQRLYPKLKMQMLRLSGVEKWRFIAHRYRFIHEGGLTQADLDEASALLARQHPPL